MSIIVLQGKKQQRGNMKIAVLNYAISEAAIYEAPEMDTTEEVERWLEDEKDLRLDDIYYMADVQYITYE